MPLLLRITAAANPSLLVTVQHLVLLFRHLAPRHAVIPRTRVNKRITQMMDRQRRVHNLRYPPLTSSHHAVPIANVRITRR